MSDEHQVKKRKSSPELDASPAKKRKVNPDSDEDQVEGQIAPEFDEPPAKKLKLALESDVDQLKERNATSESNKDPPKEREVTPESDEGKPKEPKNTPGSGEFPAEKRTPSPVSVEDFDVSTPADKLLVRKHSEKARTPTRGSPLAAGYDLYSAEQKRIPARGKAVIDTQISIAVPEGTYGRVAPRSGLAAKFGIDTGAGVIDADYRGILYILLFNLGDQDFEVNEGDRVAQLVLERIYTPEISEVKYLGETIRGNGGFGSTGGHKAL